METFGLIITPLSSFGTPLKGDTLFGHFCWQVAEDPSLLQGGLQQWTAQYLDRPFAVFSSAFPLLREKEERVLLPRPLDARPTQGSDRRQRFEQRKEEKKRKWMVVPKTLQFDKKKISCASEAEVFRRFLHTTTTENARSLRLLPPAEQRLTGTCKQAHNTINRLTMTTGTGFFAPFSHENLYYLPGLQLIIFVGIDESALDSEQLKRGMERIGHWGFGRDASTGLGRFRVESLEKIPWPQMTKAHEACYTLAPSVPAQSATVKTLATPFTRFGRHGSTLATGGQPYKNPVVMADEGALFFPKQPLTGATTYLGTGLTGLSKADDRTIAQGYSLYLPY